MLHWQDPLAVDFGRRMFRIIKGREAPQDLFAATKDDRSVVGAWAAAWLKDFSKHLAPGQLQDLYRRCETDIDKKRKCRGVRDLGAVAMANIVPGIVRKMAGGRS